MRFECPACRHSQRTGGKCEKCGVDFIKYIGAVVAAKKPEADAIQDKFEQRSTFMKNLVVCPFHRRTFLDPAAFRRARTQIISGKRRRVAFMNRERFCGNSIVPY